MAKKKVPTVEVVMDLQISGFRNLEAWPAPGESCELPEPEAQDLVVNGYAHLPTEDDDETDSEDDDSGTAAEDGDGDTAAETGDSGTAAETSDS